MWDVFAYVGILATGVTAVVGVFAIKVEENDQLKFW